MHDQRGAVERGRKKPFVALEFQRLRHDVIGIRQHAVGGDDHKSFDAQGRHGHATPVWFYCETSVTTLETGRWLTVGSLELFMTSSSY